MSQTIYCDICGKVGRDQRLWLHGWNEKDEAKHFDLCKDCYDKIKEIVEG